jgi:hypothetical protein
MYGQKLYMNVRFICISFPAAFLRSVFFGPDDEGEMFLRNVD